jgi:hypothetical protein
MINCVRQITRTSRRIGPFGLFLFCFILAVPSFLPAEENAVLDYAYIRIVHEFDCGTIHVFLKNPGETPLAIEKMYLNNTYLDNLPNETAVWTQVLPNPIPPKGISDVAIRLRYHADNYKPPFLVKMELSGNTQIEIPVQQINGSFKITGIYFNEKLNKVYVYVQNTGTQPLKPAKIILGTEDVTQTTRIYSPQIMPGEKGMLVISLEKPCTKGEYLGVKIIGETQEIAEAVVRVFPALFPITSWDGDTRAELSFDPLPFHIPYDIISKPASIGTANPDGTWLLMGCPNCSEIDAGKTLGTNANELIKRAKECYQSDPLSRPSNTHVCEAMKEIAYFIYGEVCDIMFINPYEIVFHAEDPNKDGYFAHLAKLACEPRPLMTIPEAFMEKGPFPSPEEERLLVYYQIIEGIKGISYCYSAKEGGYKANPELEKEIGGINQELQRLKQYLKISEPFPGLAVSSDPKVLASTIVAGDSGLVLLLMNTDYTTEIKDGKRHTDFIPKKDFQVQIKVPNWLKIKKISEVNQAGKLIDYQAAGDKITLKIDNIAFVNAG